MAASLQRILRRLVPGVRRDRGGSSEVRTETVRQGSELKCVSWAQQNTCTHTHAPQMCETVASHKCFWHSSLSELNDFGNSLIQVYTAGATTGASLKRGRLNSMGKVSEPVRALGLLTHTNNWTFLHNDQRMLESLLRQLLVLGLYPLLARRKRLGRS